MDRIQNTGRSCFPPIEGEGAKSPSDARGAAVDAPQVPHDQRVIYRTGRHTGHPDLLAIRPHSPQAGAAGAEVAHAASVAAADSLAAISSVSAASHSSQKSEGEALRTLKALAEATLKEVRDKDRDNPGMAKDLDAIKKLVYRNYIYFPHSAEQARQLVQTVDPQRCKQSIRNLMHLDADPGVLVLSQRLTTNAKPASASAAPASQPESMSQRQATGSGHVSIRQAVKRANKSSDPRMEATKLLADNFLIQPTDWESRAKTGADGVESRLSVCVRPEHADALANVLADLCKSEDRAHSFAQTKFLGPRDHGIRNETGLVYLSSADPEMAAALGEEIHQRLMQRLGDHVQPSEVYMQPPPGSETVRRGISYSEKAIGALYSESSGEGRAAAVMDAVLDCLDNPAGLDEALARRLAERGYSPDNPAFALHSGEDAQAIENRMLILKTRDPAIAYPDACLSVDQMEALVSAHIVQAGAHRDKGKLASDGETAPASEEGTAQHAPPATVGMMRKVIDIRLRRLEEEMDALSATMARARHELDEIDHAMMDDDADEELHLDDEAERLEQVLEQASAAHAGKEELAGTLRQQRSNLNALCQTVAAQLNAARGDDSMDAETCAEALTAACIAQGPALDEELRAALGRLQAA